MNEAREARQNRCVPMELLDGATLTSDVDKHELITYDDVEIETESFLSELRDLQDQLVRE
jgi:predicted homoserine dehydrogenase-like protein